MLKCREKIIIAIRSFMAKLDKKLGSPLIEILSRTAKKTTAEQPHTAPVPLGRNSKQTPHSHLAELAPKSDPPVEPEPTLILQTAIRHPAQTSYRNLPNTLTELSMQPPESYFQSKPAARRCALSVRCPLSPRSPWCLRSSCSQRLGPGASGGERWASGRPRRRSCRRTGFRRAFGLLLRRGGALGGRAL